MNGVVVLCSKTGNLLYSQAYARNYGLPTGHGSGGGGRPLDELNLAAMMFALFVNSREVVVPPRSGPQGAGGGEGGHAAGLRLYEIGHTTMHFEHSDTEHVLCVAFVESVVGEEIGRFLAQRILRGFMQKYFGATAGSPAGAAVVGHTPQKKFRPTKSLLRSAFQELPCRVFELLMSRIEPSVRPSWMFCAMSGDFMAQIDWDDFLQSERGAQGPASTAVLQAEETRAAEVAGNPSARSASAAASAAAVVAAAADSSSGVYQERQDRQRRQNIPKVGFRAPKRRWWNSAAKPEHSLTSLGPLQCLYRGGSSSALDEVGGCRLQPSRSTLTALVGAVHKAGKVLSSVGDVR
eukprot:COSAG01_NODE_346_length_18524_cov_35.929661_2_plen_350_part_00